jgi:hypothetical protein
VRLSSRRLQTTLPTRASSRDLENADAPRINNASTVDTAVGTPWTQYDPRRRAARLGQEWGKTRVAAGFSATIKSMTEALPPFLTRYARLEVEGPHEDRNELNSLNAHETQ